MHAGLQSQAPLPLPALRYSGASPGAARGAPPASARPPSAGRAAEPRAQGGRRAGRQRRGACTGAAQGWGLMHAREGRRAVLGAKSMLHRLRRPGATAEPAGGSRSARGWAARGASSRGLRGAPAPGAPQVPASAPPGRRSAGGGARPGAKGLSGAPPPPRPGVNRAASAYHVWLPPAAGAPRPAL